MARRQKRMAVGLVCSAMVLGGIWQQSAGADVSSVTGSAYGYYASISIFGGPANVAGPDPTVTLPETGGDESATSPSASAVFGPANIFTSGELTASTEGTTGPDGSVTSSASASNINTSEQEIFTADEVTSTCTASESGISGSSAITNGALRVSEGDPDVDGDDTIVDIPADPAVNTTFEGTIEAVGDNFRVVFNEQIVDGDTITVNAVHEYLLGPSGVGDVIIGQTVCGVSTSGDGDGGDGATTTTTVSQGGGGGDNTTTTARSGERGQGRTPAATPESGEPNFTG